MPSVSRKVQTCFALIGKVSRQHLLGGVALAAMTVSASAQSVNTFPQWNGITSISSWGVPNTATYGQTITATTTQNALSSFTFQLGQNAGTPSQYQAFVYQWDSVNQRIVGTALYTSGVQTAPGSAAFTPVTLNTGIISLTPGQQYVLFLTTSTQSPQPGGTYRYGSVVNTAYAGGQFVFNNNGTDFGLLSTTNWSTIANDLAFNAVFLSLIAPYLPVGAPINPINVAAAIDKASIAGVILPAGFLNLFALAPDQLVSALSALSGENNTQAQQGAFQLGNSYLSLLTDPFSTNRVGSSGPLGFAPERQSNLPPSLATAYAKYGKSPLYTKAPPLAVYEPRWDVWGAAFGGTNSTRGDPTGLGSHDTTTRAGGVAAGADYRFGPNALIGFSLAGGNINWSVAGNGFGWDGRGNGDTFMAGVYGKYSNGPGYLSAAATFANYWMKTDRTVAVAGLDTLHADFNAQSWGGRLEGGYRLPTDFLAVGWTPYAAIQAQSFHTPSYGEFATGGSNQFALNFASRTATAVRGEIGLRADKAILIDNGARVDLFAKGAYAHDDITNPSLAANFTALGIGAAPFTVYGARPSRDLALATAGAEWKFANGVSMLVKFDGEFGDRSETYSGTGRLRYTW